MLCNGKPWLSATLARSLLLLSAVLVPIPAAHSSDAASPPARIRPSVSRPAAPAVKKVDEIPNPAVGKNYIVLPITTNLQRAKGRAYEKAKFFVLINGSPLFNEDDTVLKMAPLGIRTLRETMSAHLAAGVRGDTVIQIRWPRPLPQPKDYEGESASFALDCLLRTSWGFPGAIHVERLWPTDWRYAPAWESLVADLTKEPPDGAIHEEAGIGDDQVRLYPIRTPLSRLLFGVHNDSADCVIHIMPPLEQAKASTVMTMQRCLPKLNLKNKNFVWFLETWKDPAASNAVRDDFTGEHVWKDLLGFKSCGCMAWN